MRGKEIPEDPWRAENYDFWTEKGEFNNFDENLNIKEIFKHLPILRFIEPIIDETFNEIKRVNPKLLAFRYKVAIHLLQKYCKKN